MLGRRFRPSTLAKRQSFVGVTDHYRVSFGREADLAATAFPI